MRKGDLINLAKTILLVLHKELEYKEEKLKYKKLEIMQPRIKNKSELLVDVNHPGSVHMMLINAIQHLTMKNDTGERRRRLITYGELNRGFTVFSNTP